MQISVGINTGTPYSTSIHTTYGGFITLRCGNRSELSVMIPSLDDAERMVTEINRAVAELRAALAKEGT